MSRTATLLCFVLLAACNKPPSTPPTTEPADDAQPDAQPDTPPDTDTGEARPGITAAACEEQGGKVVGDIGDGAIHKPDYVCPDSGAAPIGTITAEPDGPVAVEGSVCCK
jgi:hypothetical protein